MFKKLSAVAGAVAVAMLPALTFAEETSTNITVPTQFTNVNFTQFISDLASSVATPVIGVIGLMAGIWVLQLIWRKIRSVGR